MWNSVAQRARRLVRIAHDGDLQNNQNLYGRTASTTLILTAVLAVAIWVAIDVSALPRSSWSPWPKWTAAVLYDFGFRARDFELSDRQFELQELADDD